MIEFPPHIDWLKNRFGEKLEEKLGKTLKLQDILQSMIEADPTAGKKLVDWMVRGVIQDTPAFRWEDIAGGNQSKVHTVLKTFVQFSRNLSSEEKNINNYSSLSEIWKTVKPFMQEKVEVGESNKLIKRKEREQALEESKIIYRDENLIVAVPLTKRAAQWWGKGTQWCTAADTNNYFDNYNKTAPLIVMIVKGEKFQLHTYNGNLQWMDENDHPISKRLVTENWKLFEPIVKWLMRFNGEALNYFPAHLLTQEIYNQAVAFEPWALPIVPFDNRNQEMYLNALEQSDEILEYVPEELITAEILDNIKHWNGFTIAHIKSPLMTDEIYVKALLNDPELIRFIPHRRINLSMTTACIMGSKNMDMSSFFRISNCISSLGLGKNIISPECLSILLRKTNMLHAGLNIDRLEENNLITDEIFEILCENFSDTLSRYPSIVNASEERVNCYLSHAYNGLGTIRKDMITRKAYEAAVSLDAMMLKKVPKIWKDYRMYLIAAGAKSYNYEILDQVPKSFKTKEFYQALVNSEGLNLRLVPKDMWDKQMILNAVKSNGYALNYLDDDFFKNHLKRIEEQEGSFDWNSLYLLASKTSSNILESVPREKLTREICLNLCKISFTIIKIVPQELVDDSFILRLLDYGNRSICCIPDNYFTEAVKKQIACIIIQKDYGDNFFADELPEYIHTDILAKVEELKKTRIEWDHTQLDQLHQEFEAWSSQRNKTDVIEYNLSVK